MDFGKITNKASSAKPIIIEMSVTFFKNVAFTGDHARVIVGAEFSDGNYIWVGQGKFKHSFDVSVSSSTFRSLFFFVQSYVNYGLFKTHAPHLVFHSIESN